MAYYAFLDENNVVTEVIPGIDENELIEGKSPEEWYGAFRGQKCVRTSFNNRIRKRFAGIGYKYDEVNDVFIRPQPYPSWSLDNEFEWQAPKLKPKDLAHWDENQQEWISVES